MHTRVVLLLVPVAACVLAACGGSGRPAGLDRSAVVVADDFTRLAFNDHDCSAADRYLANRQLCAASRAGGMIPSWSRFSLTSHRIRRTGCRLDSPRGLPGPAETAGCIQFTARSGFLIRYAMTQTAHGWRIAEIGVDGAPGTSAAPLDRQALAVADAFTRLAWNKHDCRAGSRYLLPGLPGAVCPARPSGTFPINSHHIQSNRCGHGNWNGGYRISPGCIEYTASNGEMLQYSMTKTPQGWRIIETGTGTSG